MLRLSLARLLPAGARARAAPVRLFSTPEANTHVPTVRVIARDDLGRAYGTGRRKTSSARVWVLPGDVLRRPVP